MENALDLSTCSNVKIIYHLYNLGCSIRYVPGSTQVDAIHNGFDVKASLTLNFFSSKV